MSDLSEHLKERDELFRNPTTEAARAWWRKQKWPKPLEPSVPLATVHKARLQWLDATNVMLEESKQWLIENGYELTMKGAPPLTPEQRDAQRVSLGKPPLGDK